MTYQEEAEGITPAKAEVLLRALDNISEVDPDLRPGHISYRSKLDMVVSARTALAAIRTPIEPKI